MAALLQNWLLEEHVLPETTIRKAAERQSVYGGSFDTAILELGAMSEAALWTRLAAATGLPAPDPGLYEAGFVENPPVLPAERTWLLRAVPIKVDAGALKVLCADPVAADEIRAAAAEQGLAADLYVVPEVRLFAARETVYGEPLPARYAPLWARIRGDARAHRSPTDEREIGEANLPPAARTNGSAPPLATSSVELAEPPAPSLPISPIELAAPPSRLDDGSAPSDDAAALPPPSPPSPPPPRQPVASAPARSGLEDSVDEQVTRTPLEYFLDLSQPPSGVVAHEMDNEVGAQPTTTMADRSSGLVRLDVAPTPAVLPETPPPLEQSLLDFGLTTRQGGPSGRPLDPGDAATEALCRRARDAGDKGRTLSLRALRRRLTHPAVQDLLGELRVTAKADGDSMAAIQAIEALEELRDGAIVPLLIERLNGGDNDVGAAAYRALVALAAQDFGRSHRRWSSWAQTEGQRPRVYWLLDGLDHKQDEIRKAASEELRSLSGDSFGYAFDAPKPERDAARLRWSSWVLTLRREPNGASPTD